MVIFVLVVIRMPPLRGVSLVGSFPCVAISVKHSIRGHNQYHARNSLAGSTVLFTARISGFNSQLVRRVAESARLQS